MNCPDCNETLIMADRQGIEIDYCTKCRGVWLDRGELDKIIERTASYTPAENNLYDDNKQRYPDSYTDHNNPHYRHKKKKGFLSDFFDFD
jgi:Zn-finger nucleic acid-binding protein